jgi:hypothetical protein
MKICRYLIVFALCLGTAGFARAAAIDFNMNVLDPLSGGVVETTNSFAISFISCTSASLSGHGLPAGLTSSEGCFLGVNATSLAKGDADDFFGGQYHPDSDDATFGTTWTSLVLTFTNNGNLGGFSGCGTLDPGDAIFGSETCTVVGSIYTLSFSGGSIAPGESFLIVEDGVAPASFPAGIAVANATPEPNSLVLLSSGTLMMGTLLFAKRRRLQRNPVRS